MINTYGKIILENGQKVYKRFGAAVVLKIKLGTAAFADIVKSTSVTEEGSVPDAILVAQQQQLIGQQQETIANLQAQINSLNSATYKLQGGEQIPWGSDLNNYTIPGNYYIASNAAANSILNTPVNQACTLKVEYGTGNTYPRQMYITYNGFNGYTRFYTNGIWSEWKTIFSV